MSVTINHQTNSVEPSSGDLSIGGSGKVGIGTTSPSRPLTIVDATNDGSGGILVQNYLPTIELDDASGGGTSTIIKHDGTNTIVENGGSERMRLDSNGMAIFSGSIMSKDNSLSTSGVEGGELILRAGSDANQTKRVVLDNYDNTFRLVGQTDSDATSGYVIFRIPNGFSLYSNSSGAAANLGVSSSGEIYRSTSSRRYKNTITDATHGLTELLNLRPVTYKGNSSGDTIFGGLIAEEVHEAGLTEFVDYLEDENGDKILDGAGNLQPDAIHYANMVSICIKAIQEQQETITALEARVVALEAN